MIKIKNIDKNIFEEFANNYELSTFYESIEWQVLKEKEGKKTDILGLYKGNKLIGVSLIIYVRILKNYYYAYASRGFLYDYKDIKDFKTSLCEFYKGSNVVFVRIDPPIILNTYDKHMNKFSNEMSAELITKLKSSGFKHFGYNLAFETDQFRFVHIIEINSDWSALFQNMSKSTKKNIELSEKLGVEIEISNNLDEVYNLFQKTIDRKKIYGYSKGFYEKLLCSFDKNSFMYLAYINKSKLVNNINNELNNLNKQHSNLKKLLEKTPNSKKIQKEIGIVESLIDKDNKYLEMSNNLEEKTYIASMLLIKKYNEVVSFVSGMDNKYRDFCPKYAMYPALIKYAVENNIRYVNFLGVKNIFNKTDKDYGVYEVKKGFGGNTVEYIGQFDLPINKSLYAVYKLYDKMRRLIK